MLESVSRHLQTFARSFVPRPGRVAITDVELRAMAIHHALKISLVKL